MRKLYLAYLITLAAVVAAIGITPILALHGPRDVAGTL